MNTFGSANVSRPGVLGVLRQRHEVNVLFTADGDDRDEAGEQGDGGDDGGADRDTLGFGLRRVADRIQVRKDLTGAMIVPRLLLFHLVRIISHFADAVGIVRYRTKDVHGDRVACQGEHADTGHGHAIGDEQGWCAGVDQAPTAGSR